MSKLLNTVGDILDPNLKFQLNRVGDIIKPNLGNKYVERLPYDQSMFGFLDPALRKLPPTIAREVAKIIKVGGWYALKIAGSLVMDALSDLAKGIKYDINKGCIKKFGVGVDGLVDKLKDKIGLGSDNKNPVTPLGKSNTGERTRVDLEYSIDWSSYSNVIVTSSPNEVTNTSESDDKHVNKIAEADRVNSSKFIPQEPIIWAISLNKYEDPEFGCILPNLPSFVSKYDSDFNIDYGSWLPAEKFSYNRMTSDASSKFDYGWNHSFSQITSFQRGTELSIYLQDDRDRNFSEYANKVAFVSASYENASVTYWRSIVFQIDLLIMNRQWETLKSFSLLGLLQNSGNNEYSPDLEDTITYKFDIIGELPEFKPIGNGEIGSSSYSSKWPGNQTNSTENGNQGQ